MFKGQRIKNMKDEMPFVSIIIPTYNSEDTMQVCLGWIRVGRMNIAFLAPGFLPNWGGAGQYIYHMLIIQFPAPIGRQNHNISVKNRR